MTPIPSKTRNNKGQNIPTHGGRNGQRISSIQFGNWIDGGTMNLGGREGWKSKPEQASKPGFALLEGPQAVKGETSNRQFDVDTKFGERLELGVSIRQY